MSTLDAQAGAISFAHLAGITAPVHAAKADAPDDKDDKKDAKKADDDTDDETMESDEPEKDDDKKDDAKAESDEPDEDDEPKKDKAKKASTSGVARGIAQERARWTAVIGSRAFVRNPAIGAHLLANTPMSAAAILGALRDAPAGTGAVDAARAARNPNLGTSAPAVAVTTDMRWGAAFKRAGVLK
jgi:hypothetical protein